MEVKVNMPNRLRSATVLRIGDSGSSSINDPSNQSSERTVPPIRLAETAAPALSVRFKIRECRKCLRELHSLLIEALVVVAAAGIFWWYARQAFERSSVSTSGVLQGAAK
jgi:hypothetical protein